MRTITIKMGRILQRRLSVGDYLLGLIHVDPQQAIAEGNDYLLIFKNPKIALVELPTEYKHPLTSEMKNHSIDDLLCSPTWRRTADPSARIVRLIKQFTDSNGWLVFGPQQESSLQSDQWFDIANDALTSISTPTSTQGQKAMGLARAPIWPHPDGQLYSLAPNFPTLRAALAGATQMKVQSRDHYGFAKILEERNTYGKSTDGHPLWAEHFRSMEMSDYQEYLHILHKTGITEEEKPMSAAAHAAHEQRAKKAVDTLVNHLQARPERPRLTPLSPSARAHILATSSDPVECTNAVFEAVLCNDTTVTTTPAWNMVGVDHLLFCMAPALAHKDHTLVNKITENLAQSDCSFKDLAFLNLIRMAERQEDYLAQTQILRHYTPEELTSDWEKVAYTVIPYDPQSLRHWVKIYDQVMFENVLAYTLNTNKEHITWEEKCLFMKEIIANSQYKWKQNAVFTRATFIRPAPTIEQWEHLFTTLGTKAVPQKGLKGEAEESFTQYWEKVCAQTQKSTLENVLHANEQPVGIKKKI